MRKRRDLKSTCAVNFWTAAWAKRNGLVVSLILEYSVTPSTINMVEGGSARRIHDPVCRGSDARLSG
eukprot:7607111-Heterocapsa_arctica.AAC.1